MLSLLNQKTDLIMKRTAAVFAAVVILFSYTMVPVLADTSNANGSNTTVNSADYAYYRKYEYGYRVSVYAGLRVRNYPSDRERLSSLLYSSSLAAGSEDYALLGTVDLVNPAMGAQIKRNTYVGGMSKISYREEGAGFVPRYTCEYDTCGQLYSFWKWDLPVFKNADGSEKDIFTYFKGGTTADVSPDAVALGESDDELTEIEYVTPEEYFLSRTTLAALLTQISIQKSGNGDWFGNLFAGKDPIEITSSGQKLICGEDVWEDDLDPLGRCNMIPFVVIYEPLVLVYLRGSTESVLLTATEFAMSQGINWNWFTATSNTKNGIWPANGNHILRIAGKSYDYTPLEIDTGDKTAQAVQSLVFGSLPSSVYLDESWFGHPKFSDSIEDPEGNRLLSNDGNWWSVQAIVEYGGWGMEFFAPADAGEGDELDLGITPVLPNAAYAKGKQVVTSFNVSNASALRSVFPDDGITAEMTVYDQLTGRTLTVESDGTLALPVKDSTVVWFSWTVPEDAGDKLIIRGRIVFPGGGTDITPANNVCSFNAVAGLLTDSSVPSEGYLTERVPSGLPPADHTDRAYWSEWRYEQGTGFVKYTFSCRIDTGVASVPDPAGHPVYDGIADGWTVKSGYGFELNARAGVIIEAVKSVRGAYVSVEVPDGYAVSPVQYASACFPEKGYSTDNGKYETLEEAGTASGGVKWQFRENPDAEGDRIHYIPVSYPDGDGNYSPYVIFSQCWTPAGMIEAGASPKAFSISGSLFDDWYQGR